MLFSLNKKGDSKSFYGPWGHYAEWNRPIIKKANTTWVHLCKVPRVVIIDTRCLIGIEFHFGKIEFWNVNACKTSKL